MKNKRSPKTKTVLLVMVACFWVLANASYAAAIIQPGTGYDLRQRGLSQSTYFSCLFYVTANGLQRPCPAIAKTIDFSANPFNFTQGTNAFVSAWERRWGRPDLTRTPPDSGAWKRKNWAFLDNERGAVAKAMIEWACEARPDLLGISPGSRTCTATSLEVIDFSAGGDIDLARQFFLATAEGATPARPALRDRLDKGCTWSESDPWWFGWTVYYRNTAAGACSSSAPAIPPVVTPPTTQPVTVTTIPSCGSWCGEALDLLRKALSLFESNYVPSIQSTGRVGVRVVP